MNGADFGDEDRVRNVVEDSVGGHDDDVTVLNVELIPGRGACTLKGEFKKHKMQQNQVRLGQGILKGEVSLYH